jgi:hypothetical protein
MCVLLFLRGLIWAAVVKLLQIKFQERTTKAGLKTHTLHKGPFHSLRPAQRRGSQHRLPPDAIKYKIGQVLIQSSPDFELLCFPVQI